MRPGKAPAELLAENEDLRNRLEEAEATLLAIGGGEVDAFLIRHKTDDEEKVLVLSGVDRPYRLLIERMNQGAVTLTPDGVVVYANRRLTEMLGTSLQDLVGTALGRFVAVSDRRVLTDLLEHGLTGDAELELTLETAGGGLPVLLTASRLLEEADVLCLIVTDLTQKKRQEAERERLMQERAAREVAEQAAAVLRESDRRKDEFLAMLAHELRNPLAPLRNGLQVLGLIGSKEAAVQKTREMMCRQVDSLVRLVDDLLDVSRVSRGKLQLHKKVIDLKVVVLLAVENCRAIIDDRRHDFQLSLPEAPLPVEVDPLRLSQVVVNLLNNAAKFTPRGGRIGLTIEPGADGSDVVLQVSDSGIGIAPEMLPKIFDLFIQADPTVSRAEGGLGIGLTLVRSLVEMHGGRLQAASAGLGRGSEITVRLPLSRDAGETGAAPPEVAGETPASPPPTALRILVVDDNRDAGESLTILLRLVGHDVRQEWDGPHAVAAAAEFLPDLVLLDLGMPGMSGFEVAQELRSRPALQKARLVALTGYGSPEDKSQSRAAGFHHHLVKPVELSVLEPILASIAAG